MQNQSHNPRILIVTPEVAYLPDGMGETAEILARELEIDRQDVYGRVAYPKSHSRDDVPLIYRLAAASGGVFVNPALIEPFGLTLIEAAASGLVIPLSHLAQQDRDRPTAMAADGDRRIGVIARSGDELVVEALADPLTGPIRLTGPARIVADLQPTEELLHDS